MYLMITIDTEEDNWGDYRIEGQSFENIKRIPYLQEMFEEFGVKPTYLITYPVATDEACISILKKILDDGKCEIGTHCHPWNTWPFEEEKNRENRMLCNLPAELQSKKIETLHKKIVNNFGTTPVSFRAGRWAFNEKTAQAILKLGYKIDSSVTPYTDWLGYYGPDYSDISPNEYRFNAENIILSSNNGSLLEVPVTIGFLQHNFKLASRMLKSIKNYNKFKLIGFLNMVKILNKVWLSPEITDAKKMVKLTKSIIKNGIKILNMTFHSSSLIGGLSPFIKDKEDEEVFFKRIKDFLTFSKNEGFKPITLKEVLNFYAKDLI